MTNSYIAELELQLKSNKEKILNAKNSEEYLSLMAERKAIIKQLNDMGVVVRDDISGVSAIPIFEDD